VADVSGDGLAEWRDFARLREAWSLRREATGGLNALAGFDFQCAAALLAAARAFRGDRRVLIEALSDLSEIGSAGVTITQAKRTLTSSSLRSALEELWSIDLLAATETPNLRPKLRYGVLASRRELKDVEASLTRWVPGTVHSGDDLSRFKARISVNVEYDPRLALAAYLLDAFAAEDPFALADNLIGMTFRHLASGQVEAAAGELMSVSESSIPAPPNASGGSICGDLKIVRRRPYLELAEMKSRPRRRSPNNR
jgi:hypothetical protein